MIMRRQGLYLFTALTLSACSQLQGTAPSNEALSCPVQFVVLGTAQDAGTPQIGNSNDPAWDNTADKRLAASAAVVDIRHDKKYLFEATPDIRQQLKDLDKDYPSTKPNLGLSNVFITHAHIGHYAGLMFFGRESASTKNLKVNVMPRMASFLENNGPWEQLVSLKNISLENTLQDGQSHDLEDDISVTPLRVPHRDEYSETVGFIIKGPEKSILFLPDIDDWERWTAEYERDISQVTASLDAVFIDATFFDNNELPGRDMTKIPHPRVTNSMARLSGQASKVHFIHINHTNPLRDPKSSQTKLLRAKGFNVAYRGQKLCL